MVGEYPTPEDASWLRDEHSVTSVVNLQDDGDLASKGLRLADLQAAYAAHGLPFHRIPVPDCDGATLGARLDDTVRLLADLVRHGHRVYLHCNAGLNRAPTMAIAYLHVHHGLSLTAARDFVRARRNCAPYMNVLEAHYGRPA
jgi:protein-tyrosine phosphatase